MAYHLESTYHPNQHLASVTIRPQLWLDWLASTEPIYVPTVNLSGFFVLAAPMPIPKVGLVVCGEVATATVQTILFATATGVATAEVAAGTAGADTIEVADTTTAVAVMCSYLRVPQGLLLLLQHHDQLGLWVCRQFL